MIVVADTSPFIALIKIGHIDILPRLFGIIVIPDAVARELSNPVRPASVLQFIAQIPPWLSVQHPAHVKPIAHLDPGETEAINLALELNADLLLIDEAAGRSAAITLRISTIRTAAVPAKAANVGVLADLKSAFNKLMQTDFRVPAAALEELLRQHEEFRRRGN